MAKGVFITGTDTGIGKTWFTVMLMNALKNRNQIVVGMKPVASGATEIDGQLINDDAAMILQHCSAKTKYELINPVVFEQPVSPHLAAKRSHQSLNLKKIKTAYETLAETSDIVVVEGVGGWRVPLSDNLSVKDLVKELGIPVILVVGLRLGCINHALLTAETIRADGFNLIGWVSNLVEKDCLFPSEVKKTISEKLLCPLVADLDYMDKFSPQWLNDRIDLSAIFD